MSDSLWDRLVLWWTRRKLEKLACRAGGWKHAELQWMRGTSARWRKIAAQNQPCEIMAASGFGMLAQWIGVCPDCKHAVEWSTEKP